MKNIKIKTGTCLRLVGFVLLIMLSANGLIAQSAAPDSSGGKHKLMQKFRAMKPVKNTFDDNYILDNQTVIVNRKKSIQFDIQHRFGVVTNGYKDFLGIFSAANIRFGMSGVPCDKLMLGWGFNKYNLTWDFDGKFALMRQSEKGKGIWPLSITAYANIAVDSRNKKNFVRGVDRLSYFGQILIARKITKNFSLQVGADVSWFNNVEAYINTKGEIIPKRNNEHFAVSVMARYKCTDKIGILINYDQPLTKHLTDNPHPNLGIGLDFTLAQHDFQVTFSNFNTLIPQINNFYNQNDYKKGSFCIGFNMSRLWYF